MKICFTHISQLLQTYRNAPEKRCGREMNQLPYLENAWMLIENDRIVDFGSMDDPLPPSDREVNCTGRTLLPTWCDSHTHLVYAGNREQEFVDRIKGLSYQEIAQKGGGILNSAKKLRDLPEDELYAQSAERILAVMRSGTGAIEIKSGYGLETQAECKMLRVARKLGEDYPIAIRTSFLGAHALPETHKDDKAGYVDLVCEEMLPKVTAQRLADYVDVFCEEGYFDVADTARILQAARRYGLRPKIHVNQFNSIGGIEVAVAHDALTVDHLEVLSDEDLKILRDSNTMPVALPACSYFLGIPYTPARLLIDAGLPLAIATDFNPGSAPTGNMNFVVSAACIKMRLTPEEAINAATINGAYAMGLSGTHGTITPGKKASFIITEPIPSYGFIPYSFGFDHIEQVYVGGQPVT